MTNNQPHRFSRVMLRKGDAYSQVLGHDIVLISQGGRFPFRVWIVYEGKIVFTWRYYSSETALRAAETLIRSSYQRRAGIWQLLQAQES